MHMTMWMNLKMIILREAKQKQVYSYVTRLLSNSRKCRLTFTDGKQMVAAWEWGQGRW